MAKSKQTIIAADVLYDGRKRQEKRTVVVDGDTIVDVSARSNAKSSLRGIVTPAIIDPHNHIGMFREGEPGGEQEGNEFLHQILPLSDPLNSVYFDDRAFKDAVD